MANEPEVTKEVSKVEDAPLKQVVKPKSVGSPVKVYTPNIGKRTPPAMWEVPIWDLGECARIADTESYVRRAFKIKKNLFLK